MKKLIILMAIAIVATSCTPWRSHTSRTKNKKSVRVNLRHVYFYHQTETGKKLHSAGEKLFHSKD